MSEARQVDLIFSYKKLSLGSALIRLHQRANYSHAAIKFFSNYMDMDLVYEANISGVRILSYETWLAEGNVITARASFQIHADKMREKLQRAFSFLERPYGKLTILSILFNGQAFGADGTDSFICSEIAHDFLEYELPRIDKSSDQITPKDLFKLVRAIK